MAFDPHDHVNRSQSTLGLYPTSMHIGMALGNVQIVAAYQELIDAFKAKGQVHDLPRWDGRSCGCRPDDARSGVRAFDARWPRGPRA